MKTKNTRKVRVGTVKKSTDTKSWMWLARKVLQVCEGGLRCRTVYFTDSSSNRSGAETLSNSNRALMFKKLHNQADPWRDDT